MIAEGLKKQIMLREDKCIGCLACLNACPKGLISHDANGTELRISFSRACPEKDCNRCVAVCSEKALSISVGYGELTDEHLVLSFPLVVCSVCGSGFMPERILKRMSAGLASRHGVAAEELDWLHICPECRRIRAGKPIEQPWAGL